MVNTVGAMDEYYCVFIDPDTLIIRCEPVQGKSFADADAAAVKKFPFLKQSGVTYCISDKAHRRESCLEISRIG